MRPITIQQVVDALLSGEYQQVQGYLHVKDEGFCCHGVAQDIAGCQWIGYDETVLENAETGDVYITGFESMDMMGEWGKFLNQAADRDIGQESSEIGPYLAALNDDPLGFTFVYIAQEIVRLANLYGYDVHLDRQGVEG